MAEMKNNPFDLPDWAVHSFTGIGMGTVLVWIVKSLAWLLR